MALFPLTKDLQALMLRATASLERLDGAIADVQRLTKNANEMVTEARQVMAGFRAGIAATGLDKKPE